MANIYVNKLLAIGTLELLDNDDLGGRSTEASLRSMRRTYAHSFQLPSPSIR